VLIFTPWQQNVFGTGSVIAYEPIERQQNIEAPVDGRVLRWYVVEGDRVKKGDRIVDLADNDPSLPARLQQEREALVNTQVASEQRARSLQERIAGLEATRLNAVSSARSKVDMALDRIRAAEQALKAAEANLVTNRLNLERTGKLAAKGLASTRQMELAELGEVSASAELDRAKANQSAALNDKLSLDAELLRTDNDSKARVEEARAAYAAALSDIAKANAEITKIDVRIARQNTQSVTAPIEGTIFRIIGRLDGQMLKAGSLLAVLVPETAKQVVELYMDGNDIPLISTGRHVRLQFEGWPALQFSGWPSAAVGTFGGTVIIVDPSDNGKGKFRILVAPDQQDDPWPSTRYLRQGARANGWVLLNQVSLGFEFWRQFNGFPPVISVSEPGAGSRVKEGK
jgi:multidrug efflux pump subunit AcrA (membrane-fusion protein)